MLWQFYGVTECYYLYINLGVAIQYTEKLVHEDKFYLSPLYALPTCSHVTMDSKDLKVFPVLQNHMFVFFPSQRISMVICLELYVRTDVYEIDLCFFSIGRVNPELYALGAGTWDLEGTNVGNCQNQSKLEEWVLNYVNVLCVNSWQVLFLSWIWILDIHLSRILCNTIFEYLSCQFC